MNDRRDITHNLRTAIVDADGKLVKVLHRQRVDAGRSSLPTSKRPLPRTERGAPGVFTARERRLIARLRTPLAGAALAERACPTTTSRGGRATLRSFRGVVRHGSAHCLEAALFAAVVLEQHGYPPLVLSFESIDLLDHVIFVYRGRGRWGSIARSRDPGLHGRKPVFATPRALALSYVDPYVDFTGRVTGYAVVDLRVIGRLRLAAGGRRTSGRWNGMLLDWPHRRSRRRTARQSRAEAIPRLSRREPGLEADVLSRPRSLDRVPKTDSEV